jgi:hypothetical protein
MASQDCRSGFSCMDGWIQMDSPIARTSRGLEPTMRSLPRRFTALHLVPAVHLVPVVHPVPAVPPVPLCHSLLSCTP